MKEERVLWEGKPEKIVLLILILESFFAWIIISFGLLYLIYGSHPINDILNNAGSRHFLELITLTFAVFVLYRGCLINSRRYEVYEDKIIIEEGIFNKKATIIPSDKIRNIHQYQSFFQKTLGVCDLTIKTADAEHYAIFFSGIKDPKKVFEKIMQFVERNALKKIHVADKKAGPEKELWRGKPSKRFCLYKTLTDRRGPSGTYLEYICFVVVLLLLTIFKFIDSWLGFIMFSIAIFLLIIGTYIYELLRRNLYKFTITNRGVSLSSGLVKRTYDELPYSRIHHVSADQTLSMKILGIHHLKIYSYDTADQYAEIFVPGLDNVDVPMKIIMDNVNKLKKQAHMTHSHKNKIKNKRTNN